MDISSISYQFYLNSRSSVLAYTLIVIKHKCLKHAVIYNNCRYRWEAGYKTIKYKVKEQIPNKQTKHYPYKINLL